MRERHLLTQYDDLIASAYRGAIDNRPWQAFVEKLAAAADVQHASLLIFPKQPWASPALITSANTPEFTGRGYFERIMATETMHQLNATPAAQPVALEEMLPQPQLRDTELYRQFLRPREVEHSLIVDVWSDHATEVRLAMDRTGRQGPFDWAEREALTRLAYHLRHGIELREAHESLGALSHFYNAAMDRRGIAVFVLNEYSELLGTNRCGETLLQRGHGLQVQHGKLVATAGGNRAAWQALLGKLLQPGANRSHGQRMLNARDNSVLDVVGHRLTGAGASGVGTVVLLARPGETPQPRFDRELLKDFFGFTDREADLAIALTEGRNTKDIARSLDVSPNTVKTHIRSIFEKTGCARQSQVVALLLGNDALHMH